MLRERRIVAQALWPNLCDSRSMYLSFQVQHRSAQPSRRPRRFHCHRDTGGPRRGWVYRLARPGGNITGLTRLTRELSGKRLELLTEVVPRISRVGVLWDPNPSGLIGFREYEAAARALKIQLQSLEVRGSKDFEGTFRAAAKGRTDALIMIRSPVLARHQKQIADLAIKNRMASMYETSDFVDAGGLASYSSSDRESFRRAA